MVKFKVRYFDVSTNRVVKRKFKLYDKDYLSLFDTYLVEPSEIVTGQSEQYEFWTGFNVMQDFECIAIPKTNTKAHERYMYERVGY